MWRLANGRARTEIGPPETKVFFAMRLAALLCAALLLAGCSDADWDHLMRFGDAPRVADRTGPAPIATAAQDAGVKDAGAQDAGQAAQPVAASAAAAPNAFCLSVANQRATSDGFDAATQARMAISNYRQCVAIFGPSS